MSNEKKMLGRAIGQNIIVAPLDENLKSDTNMILASEHRFKRGKVLSVGNDPLCAPINIGDELYFDSGNSHEVYVKTNEGGDGRMLVRVVKIGAVVAID